MKQGKIVMAGAVIVLIAGGVVWNRMGGTAPEAARREVQGSGADDGGSGGDAGSRRKKPRTERVQSLEELTSEEKEREQEWIDRDPQAKAAADLHKQYHQWFSTAGEAESQAASAQNWLSHDTDACRKLKLVIQMETLVRMRESPEMAPMAEALFNKSVDEGESGAMLRQWQGVRGYVHDLKGVPSEVRDALLNDAKGAIAQQKTRNETEELEKRFPPDFLVWYRKAVEASLYAGAADAYLKSNGPPDLLEVREKIRDKAGSRDGAGQE